MLGSGIDTVLTHTVPKSGVIGCSAESFIMAAGVLKKPNEISVIMVLMTSKVTVPARKLTFAAVRAGTSAWPVLTAKMCPSCPDAAFEIPLRTPSGS